MPTTVYVVRHAEKEHGQGAREVNLSQAGHRRAANLPQALDLPRLTAIYATNRIRTQQTAAAVAEATGLPIQTFAPNDTASVVEAVERHTGEAVLVVGHADTVPMILEELGVRVRVSLTLADYGDVFEVILDNGRAMLRRGRFEP